jgi:hypothetical protein
MNIFKPKKGKEIDEFRVKPNLKKAYGKNWRLMSQIRKNKNVKAVNCKCGSVKLNILSKPGKIDYKCSECGKYVETVEYDESETINSENK